YVGDTGLEHALILTPTTPVTVATAPTTANATMVSKVAGGLNYSTVPVLTNARIGSHNTTAKLLGGSASENKPLDIAFEDASAGSGTFASLASDRLSFSGTDSDRFVLSLTYDEAAAIALYGSETLTRLLWLSPQTGQFMNAVDGNSAGSVAFFAGDHAYTTADFVLGRYGVDTTNNTVWAVLDHNSVFAAGLVPEPTVMGLLSMTGGMLLRRRGRTACV
ncbi:MAG: hypothetical protein JWM57_2544, partial [Phycisphaerales bacterium]|nr:hypothetical protein [Phycisphaerales bacterium]